MKSRLVLRILWGLCCLLLLWMVVSDSIQFSKHPELYPIGCEGFGAMNLPKTIPLQAGRRLVGISSALSHLPAIVSSIAEKYCWYILY